jgi:hypothetical protein
MELFKDMPERVARAFEAYVALGSKRSLNSLAGVKRDQGGDRGIATLKRWSARYRWQTLLAQHQREVVAKMQREFKERVLGGKLNALQTLELAKERFYGRILIDPNDPKLTDAQRRRALKITLNDFFKLIKIEQLLRGGSANGPAEEAKEHYTAEELKAMMTALAQVRHNLPSQSHLG